MTTNNRAMARASEKNDFKMVLAFISHGFKVDCPMDLTRPTSLSYFSLVTWTRGQTDDTLDYFKTFSARSKTAFLLAQFKISTKPILERREETGNVQEFFDPVEHAFLHANIAIMQKKNIVEYKKKIKRVEEESKVSKLTLYIS